MKKTLLALVAGACMNGYGWAQNVFPATGNTGIGTSTPSESLEIRGHVSFSNGSLLFNAPGITDGPRFDLSPDGNYLQIGGNGLLPKLDLTQDLGLDVWRFRNGWLGTRAYLNANAFINSKDDNGLIVDADELSRVGFIKYANHNAGIWRVQNQDFEAGTVNSASLPGNPTNFTTDFYIAGNGNIGLGTKSPSEVLSVNGIMQAKGVKVLLHAADWSDYVFEKRYKLWPLSKVEQFIKQNKHLEGIPAAVELEQQGLDIGANEASLLRKIEELTLYLIQQKKELMAQCQLLDKESELLEQRLDNLAKQLTSQRPPSIIP